MKFVNLLFLLITSLVFSQKQQYLFQSEMAGFGSLNFYMTFEFDGNNSFKAYSNPKSIYNNLSFGKTVLLKTLKKEDKKGAIVKIQDGKVSGNYLNGKVESPFLKGYELYAEKTKENRLIGKFQAKNGSIEFTAKPVNSTPVLINYTQLYKAFENEISEKIYDKSILQNEDWKVFLSNLKQAFYKSNDDLDIFVSFLMNKRNLKTSHVYLTKVNPLEKRESNSPNFTFEKLNNQTSILSINNFLLSDAREIEKIISELNSPNLIIDLRKCSGGDFSSLMVASYFIKEEKYVGYFLGRKFYDIKKDLPTQEMLMKTKPFDGKTLNDLYFEIENNGILVAKIKPAKTFFEGKIFVLTSKESKSASEPLVAFLKDNNIATIIGENTGGEMLSAKSFNFFENWYITLPIANYYTFDGKWIEQNGVSPNLEMKSSEALKKVMEIIEK